LTVAETADGFETRAPRDRLSGETAKLLPKLFEAAKLSAEDLMRDRKVREKVQATVGEMISIEKGR
jgi:hypothetical protein